MANINKIKLSGTTYNIQDANASKTVELTQAQYDALVSGGTVDPNTFYIITDATAGDLSNYYTKSETSGATEISTALGNKQDTLVSSTNIKTINNQSILGEGNIEIQGGGSSYTAGDGIDITNDVISVTGKVDTSTYETYTAATATAIASKQTTLTAGTGISIVDNVISATGGTSITIDPSLDSGSTNPVANSAITEAITANQNAVFITSENRNSIVEHIENDIYELKTNDIYSISFIPKDLEYTKFRFTCYVNGTYTDVETDKNVDTATTQISITFDSETNRITVTSLDRDANKIDVFALRFFVSGYGYKDFEVSDVYITHNPSLGVVKTEYEKTIQTSYKESGGYITERKGNTEIKYNTSTTSTSNLVNGSAVNAAINKVKTRFDGFGQSYKGGQGCTNYASQSPNITDFTSGEHSVTLNNTNSARVWWFNVKLNENSTDTFGDLNINFSADGTSFGNLTLFLQMNTLEFRLGDLIKRIDVTDKTQTYSVFVPNGILVNTSSSNAVASYNVWSMTEGEPFFIESIGIFDIPQDSSCLESFDEWKSNVDTDISNLSASTRGAVDMTLNHINDSSVHVTSAEKSTWDAKSDFSGNYNDLTNKPTIPTVPTSNTAFTNDAGYITSDAISGKVDTSTYNTYTAATDTALATKQDTLVSGTNIKTINNESILGSGNITIEGGSSVNVVQTTGTSTADVMSQDAVTTQLNNKANKTAAVGGYGFGSSPDGVYIQYKNVDKTNIGNRIYYPKINGKEILTSNNIYAKNNYNFQLVETSAITTSVTSSSTDSQIPSAKAVNDKLGGLSIVKLTQSEYDALSTKDSNTLYVIVN